MHHIILTVKTPVSGSFVLTKPYRELGSIRCEDGEYEKRFEFDVEEDIFGVLFSTERFERKFFFQTFEADTPHSLDLEDALSFSEIKQCCDRDAARLTLQTYPTDPYATFQLGYVGTEEDLNFLLGILEDHYVGSTLSYGRNGKNVIKAINAAQSLSQHYCRAEVRGIFERIENTASCEGFVDVAHLCFRDCMFFSPDDDRLRWPPFIYRTDLLVRTSMVVKILDSRGNWIADIDGTVGYDKRVDWCCLRSRSEQFKITIQTPFEVKDVTIDVRDNNIKHRQVINIDPPIFTREMAKEVLESRKDRILVIPEGIETLAEDFALLFDEEDKMYHFFEIDIPASVSSIKDFFLTEYPDRVSNLQDFDEISVAPENTAFCSVDGILFSKDMKRLILYPCGLTTEHYTVPESVEVIGEYAFQNNQFLQEVTLPAALKVIEWRAFSSCENLTTLDLPEGVEEIGENAFEFAEIRHLRLPHSLKKIHWTNLSSLGSGILNLEIPNAPIEIDMSGYDSVFEESYVPPLFLIEDTNFVFEKYARRHHNNIFTGVCVDGDGIIWSRDRSTLIEFPARWDKETYRIPDTTSKVFRWAFNKSKIKQVIYSGDIEIVGNSSGNDFSRIASTKDFRFDPQFFTKEKQEPLPVPEESKTIHPDFDIRDGLLKKYHGAGGVVVVPEGVTKIGDRAFDGCSNLTKVTFPDSLATIGEKAFQGCSSLKSVLLPEETTIGKDSFMEGCTISRRPAAASADATPAGEAHTVEELPTPAPNATGNGNAAGACSSPDAPVVSTSVVGITNAATFTEEELSMVTFGQFIELLKRHPFNMKEEDFLNLYDGIDTRTFSRYTKENKYGPQKKLGYASLFKIVEDQYHYPPLTESEKLAEHYLVEHLVVEFKLPSRCISMSYYELKLLIRDTLDKKVVIGKKKPPREQQKTIDDER